MARRKRRRFPWFPLIALALLTAGGVVAWRTASTWLPWFAQPSDTEVEAVPAYLDVCALVSSTAVASALGAARVEARAVGAGPDVPAAGACTYEFEHGGRQARLVVLVFNQGSLTRAKLDASARAYYASAVTGLEYLFKETPVVVAGVGDAAVAAGFVAEADGEIPQLIARRGEAVVHVMATDVPRDAVERYIRALLARLP
jgi:hypothetical protein